MDNVYIWFLVSVNLFFLSIIFRYRYEKIDLLKLCALSCSSFFCIYAIISGLLFLGNIFSFFNALMVQILLELLLTIYFLIRYKKKRAQIICEIKKDYLIFIICLIFFLLSYEKSELYSTEQDQGLYQAEAIELYMGNFEVQHDFEEYSILIKEEDKQAYKEMVNKTFTGFYPLSVREWPSISQEEILSDVSGMYHGVQTFPAMLALSGKLFGLENMLQAQTIFYLCSIILVYYLLKELKINKYCSIIITCFIGLSPLILWVSKTALTETFLTMLISMYLLFLEEKNDKKIIALPWVAFSFVHVSVLILLPIVIAVNLIKFLLENRNKQYLCANTFCAGGLYIGYLMMSRIAPQYFFDNCNRLYYKELITKDNFLSWILLITLLIIIVSWGLFFVNEKIKCSLQKTIINIINSKIISILCALICVGIIAYGIKIGFVDNGENLGLKSYHGTGFSALQHLTLYAFMMATGYLLVPVIIFNIIFRYKKILAVSNAWVYVLLFGWMVLIQSLVFRTEVQYYYYYSRYLAFYIPIVCVIGAICINEWKGKKIILLSALSIVVMLRFDGTLLTEKDDSLWEWETLYDLEKAIEDDSAVILDASIQKRMGVYIRAFAETAIFPTVDDLESQIAMLKDNFTHVYYLSGYGELATTKLSAVDDERIKIIYKDQYVYSEYPLDVSSGIFPLNAISYEEDIVLVEIDPSIVVDVSNSKLEVRNGERTERCIISTGEKGIVVYGPYLSLDAGMYCIKIPIEILEYDGSNLGNIICYNEAGKNVLFPSVPISQYIKSDFTGTYIELELKLKEACENIEIVISAADGARFKISSYIISKTGKVNDNKTVIPVSYSKIGIQKGVRKDDYIESIGENGIVVYGPYITLNEGIYVLEIPIDIIEFSNSHIGYFRCYSEQGKNSIVDETPLSECIDINENGTYIRAVFELKEQTENIEFVITCADKSLIKVYEYSLYNIQLEGK